jgi:hypothetical protein
MTWTRRDLLKSAAAVSVFGLSGCGSDGVNLSTPEDSGASPTPVSTPQDATGTETPTPSPETETPAETETPTETPTPATPLQRDTETAFDEIEWFVAEYSVVVHRSLSIAGRIQDTLVKLRRSPALSESDLQRIEDATEGYYDFLYDEIAPHFPTERVDDIVRQSRDKVSTIRRFSERGDLDRAEREVSGLAAFYSRLSTKSIFTRKFPNFPVGSPLLDYLTAETYSTETPLLFVVSYPAEGYTTTVRADESWDIRSRLASSITDRDLQSYFERETTLFSGVDTDTGRTGRIFLNVHLNSGEVRHSPVYVQQFESARSAEDAHQSLVDSSVFVEGTEDIGRTTWEHAFYYQEIPVDYPRNGYVVYDTDGNVVYDEDGDIRRDTARLTIYDVGADREPDEQGDIVYAYLTRIGRYLIAASPSLTAWEEQPDGVTDPLEQTWLFG